MPLIGKLIKTAISIGDGLSYEPSPIEAQKKVLLKLLTTAKDTTFGKRFRFKEIADSEDPQEAFRKNLPVFNYDELFKEGWEKVVQGTPNVTWPGSPEYFAVSSGTTGAKKRIPVTDDMIESIKSAGIKQILSLNNFDLPDEFFEKEVLMFGSSTNLNLENGHLEGQISGISASTIPFWFRGTYKPGEEIASVDDWDKKIDLIAKEAPNWDIGAVSGIPTWVEQVFERIVKANEVDTIHDVWPGLRVFATGGTAFKPHQKSIEKWLKEPLIYIDTYLASEGFLAFQERPETDAMKLITDEALYFEFVEHKEDYIDSQGQLKPDSMALHIGEVQEDVEYVLLISSVGGAWRYCIGDTIKFADVERAEIKITGRTKHFLNVAGSMLTVEDLQKGTKYIEDRYGVMIPEFTVSGIKSENKYTHRWYMGLDHSNKKLSELDTESVRNELDSYFKEHLKSYNEARNNNLTAPEVFLVRDEQFYNYTEELSGRGGQTKIPRVMNEEKLEHFEIFLQKSH